MGQVSTLPELLKSLESKRKKKIVFTNGCFDLLHVGHVRYLQAAKAEGEILVVGVNSDSSVKKLKGDDRPLQNERDRAEILAALNAVDYTVIFSEDTPEKLIEQVKPNVLVKGGDWPVEKIVGHKFVQSYGGTVKSLNFVENRSTSSLIEKARK